MRCFVSTIELQKMLSKKTVETNSERKKENESFEGLRTSHPKKQTLKISDLVYNKHYEKYHTKLDQGVDKITDIMEIPIEVFLNIKIIPTPRFEYRCKI